MARRVERERQFIAHHLFTNKEVANMLRLSDKFHLAKSFKSKPRGQ
jgi:hypothetical protein